MIREFSVYSWGVSESEPENKQGNADRSKESKSRSTDNQTTERIGG